MKTIKKSGLIILGCLFLTALVCQSLYAADNKININTASQEQLMELKYIGEKIALRIIKYRKEHPFEKAEDLKNVKGIGEKVFSTNAERIVVKE